MKPLRKLAFGVILIAGLAAAATPLQADNSTLPRRSHAVRVSRFQPQSGAPYYHERRVRGGWFAVNYKYFWNHAPFVSYDDPYDYNGNYFPHPLARR